MKTSPLRIHYVAWIKNAFRKSTKYYCRVTEPGEKPFDIPLHTTDKAAAEAWVRLRTKEVEIYNSYVLAGETVPEAVASRIVRRANRTAHVTAEKRLETVIEEFCNSCASRGLRPTSQYSYLRALRAIFKSAGVDMLGPCPDMDEQMLAHLVSSYADVGNATRRCYGVTLKAFAAYVQKQLHGTANTELINEAVPKVRTDKKAHTVWSMSEMMRICERAPSLEVRVYWMIMATVGPRNSELAYCRWEDYRDGFIHLKAEYTKGRKARSIPIDFRIQGLLSELRPDSARPEDLMFPGIPTSNTGRNNQLKTACKAAGVKVGTCHTFRHSCAFYYFRECPADKRLNIKDVAALLGHSNEAITLQIYLEATGTEELSNKVQAALMEAPEVLSTIDEHLDLI